MSSCECPQVTMEMRGAGGGPKLSSFVEKEVLKKVNGDAEAKRNKIKTSV